jgi:hypothetical protein
LVSPFLPLQQVNIPLMGSILDEFWPRFMLHPARQAFPLRFKRFQTFRAIPCDMDAT